jgi:hypothetical protein
MKSGLDAVSYRRCAPWNEGPQVAENAGGSAGFLEKAVASAAGETRRLKLAKAVVSGESSASSSGEWLVASDYRGLHWT